MWFGTAYLGSKLACGTLPDGDLDRLIRYDTGQSLADCIAGCGFDVEGNLWVTLVMANKVVAITPAGEVVTMLSDPEGRVMVSPTNVSWGGPELRDLYIGSVRSDYVVKLRSPVPGMPLVHQR